MTHSTFDARTHAEDGPEDTTPVEAPDPTERFEDGLDTLALLRQANDQREEIPDQIVEVPGVPIRLRCRPDIDSKKLSNWQRRALPPRLRNSASPSPFMMDQAIFSTAVLVNTCVGVEVGKKGSPGEWRTITAAGTGEVLTLTDRVVWETLGALDSRSAIKRLFPRDSDLSRAGQQVLDAAGWTEQAMYGGDDDEEALDPTN